mmetsp:Transcript_11212/g.22331  ORF Transcript_11212/g.22331 Transcript_11212/m.22331 type:complete len:236 (+) Transcript_11212:559-1266(+)
MISHFPSLTTWFHYHKTTPFEFFHYVPVFLPASTSDFFSAHTHVSVVGLVSLFPSTIQNQSPQRPSCTNVCNLLARLAPWPEKLRQQFCVVSLFLLTPLRSSGSGGYTLVALVVRIFYRTRLCQHQPLNVLELRTFRVLALPRRCHNRALHWNRQIPGLILPPFPNQELECLRRRRLPTTVVLLKVSSPFQTAFLHTFQFSFSVAQKSSDLNRPTVGGPRLGPPSDCSHGTRGRP